MNSVLGARGAMGYVLGRGAGAAGNGLLTGLVAYWGLDEASGNALDKHTNGLTLTQANSPGASTGIVYATARTFNGSSQYFSRASESALQTGDIDFAIAAWVYLNSADAGQLIVAKGPVSLGREEFSIQLSGSKTFVFEIGNAAGQYDSIAASSFGALSSTGWHLIVAYHNATESKIGISVDGILDEKTTARNPGTNSDALVVGQQSPSVLAGYYANGGIGPVMFWKNRTLDATARAALYNGGAGLAYSSFTA